MDIRTKKYKELSRSSEYAQAIDNYNCKISHAFIKTIWHRYKMLLTKTILNIEENPNYESLDKFIANNFLHLYSDPVSGGNRRHVSNEINLIRTCQKAIGSKSKKKNKKADIARSKLVDSHLKLIISMARNYIIYDETRVIEIEDLIQEGIRGLLESIEEFDTGKRVSFTTYAIYRINTHIGDFIIGDSQIKPSNLSRSLYNEYVLLKHEKGLESIDELGVSKRRLNDLLFANESTQISIDNQASSQGVLGFQTGAFCTYLPPTGNIKGTQEMQSDIAHTETCYGGRQFLSSWHQYIHEEENVLIVEMLTNLDDFQLSHKMERANLYQYLFKNLDERELDIICRHYGININDYDLSGLYKEENMENIGKTYGRSRERIRQIKAIALNKIRKNIISYDLFPIIIEKIIRKNLSGIQIPKKVIDYILSNYQRKRL